MGVTGLWKLIESSGKPVPVDTLENKVLAIDISIWLHQVVKGFQDGKGGNLPNAHLLGLFHRLCKLLYYRVKPVFVFDGGVPQLKRETIAKRSQNRQKLQSEADRIQDLILQNLVRDNIVQQALGQEVCESLVSPSKQKALPEKPHKDDMFKLPSVSTEAKDEGCPNTSSSWCSDSTSDADSSYEDKNLRNTYQINLQAIDVTSDSFKNLPADVRHEILTDIKEMRKQSSWGRLHELPPAAIDFSGFQMKRLLKRRQVQVSLEQAEQQMEGKSLTLTELETLMSEEGILQASKDNAAKRIASDENTRFLLVKDLKKAVENAQKESKEGVKKEEIKDEEKATADLGCEYEVNLQKAIEMSLNTTQVYKDDDYEEDGAVKLNEDQRKELKTSVSSLARGYMLEYGGMNDDDIRDLIQDGNNELEKEEEALQSSFNFKHNDRFVLKGEICTPYKSMPAIKEKVELASGVTKDVQEDEVQYISSSSDESDLEEVVETENATKAGLQIIVDTTKGACAEKDDIFADIFQSDEISTTVAHESDLQEEVALKSTLQTASDSAALKIQQSEQVGQSSEDSELNAKNVEIQSVRKESCSEVTASSAASILQKLKDEINSVQSITLDAIEISKNELSAIQESSDKTKSLDTYLADETIETIDPQIKKIDNKASVTNSEPDDDTNGINDGKSDHVFCSKSAVEVISKEIIISEEKLVSSDIKSPKPIANSNTLEINPTNCEKSPSNLDEILESVKKQTIEVVNIRLDDINPSENNAFLIHDSDDSDVEIISNSKSTSPKSKSDYVEKSPTAANAEIIDITDDREAKVKTPSKGQSAIGDFFESKFTIKKTPEKNDREESPPPQVVSPFFVNKSPVGSRSAGKRQSPTTEDGPSHSSKVAKQLFESPIKVEELASDMQPHDTATSSIDVVEEAAKLLREKKSQSELANIAGDIRNENRVLEAERNRQNRMGTSITEKMAGECKELLRLFGIPYIVAPMEAEAQCAFLDAINLTDGTITDDSDVWLFGGRTVYKNFFNQKKHVLEFRMESIEKLFNMDRHKLIQLAMLVGSDYTTGVNGIGAVTAIEILAHFPITPIKEGETTEIMSILSSLRKFRDWWQCSKTVNMSGRSALRSKLKNVDLYEGFPNLNIVEAYLRPTIDDNRGRFTWGDPDIETIREFAKTKFGWTRIKTDEILQPVIKKLSERKTQASIKNYFAVKSASTVRDLKVSKRVMNAIDKMSGDYVETPPKKPKEQKRRKKKANEKKETTASCEDGEEADEAVAAKVVKPKKKAPTRKRLAKIDEAEAVPAESVEGEAVSSLAVPKKKKAPILPDSNRPIPQREKDKEEMELKKKKAIEIFKNKKGVIK